MKKKAITKLRKTNGSRATDCSADSVACDLVKVFFFLPGPGEYAGRLVPKPLRGTREFGIGYSQLDFHRVTSNVLRATGKFR